MALRSFFHLFRFSQHSLEQKKKHRVGGWRLVRALRACNPRYSATLQYYSSVAQRAHRRKEAFERGCSIQLAPNGMPL